MRIVASAQTDTGVKRSHNEDFVLQRPDLGLYVVADGMGGHAAGEVASQIAALTVEENIQNNQEILSKPPSSKKNRALNRLVRESIERASQKVYEYACSEEGKGGMGTTLSMILVVGDQGFLGHVGDSRVYLLRSGELHQLSEDHSYVEEMVRRKQMTREEASKSPYANVITRAVGIQASVQVDTLRFSILTGDTLLLCSDGLSQYFDGARQRDLVRFMSGEGLSSISHQLVEIAKERGGSDNISVILIRSEAEETKKAVEATSSTLVNLQFDTLRFISLFQNLDMKELVGLLEMFDTVDVEAGEYIIREKDLDKSLYVVLSGEIEVVKDQAQVAKLGAGAHFGEMALLNSQPRSASVRALSKSQLLVLGQDAFKSLIDRNPRLGSKLLMTFSQVLCMRLNETTQLPVFLTETAEY